MHSDIFPARHYSNWETVLILEELIGDRDWKPEEVEPLEKKGKYEVRVPFGAFSSYLTKGLFVPRDETCEQLLRSCCLLPIVDLVDNF